MLESAAYQQDRQVGVVVNIGVAQLLPENHGAVELNRSPGLFFEASRENVLRNNCICRRSISSSLLHLVFRLAVMTGRDSWWNAAARSAAKSVLPKASAINVTIRVESDSTPTPPSPASGRTSKQLVLMSTGGGLVAVGFGLASHARTVCMRSSNFAHRGDILIQSGLINWRPLPRKRFVSSSKVSRMLPRSSSLRIWRATESGSPCTNMRS